LRSTGKVARIVDKPRKPLHSKAVSLWCDDDAAKSRLHLGCDCNNLQHFVSGPGATAASPGVPPLQRAIRKPSHRDRSLLERRRPSSLIIKFGRGSLPALDEVAEVVDVAALVEGGALDRRAWSRKVVPPRQVIRVIRPDRPSAARRALTFLEMPRELTRCAPVPAKFSVLTAPITTSAPTLSMPNVEKRRALTWAISIDVSSADRRTDESSMASSGRASNRGANPDRAQRFSVRPDEGAYPFATGG
jgi:hypothetical protein